MRRWTPTCVAALALLLTILTCALPAAAGEPDSGVSANDGALISIDHDAPTATAVVGPPLPEQAETETEEPAAVDETGAAPESNEPRGEPTGDTADANEQSPAATEGDETETATAERAIPARESQGLGIPNGLFSARPAEQSDAGQAGDDEAGDAQALLSSVDPRNNPVMRVIASLGAVLGLLLLFKLMMKRGVGLLGQGGRPSGVIEILARYPLGRKQSLVLLKLARRVVLLHQNGTQMTTLSEVSDPHEVAALLSRVESGSSGKQAQRFRSMLKRFEAEHERPAPRSERDDLFPALNGNGAAGEVIDLTRRGRRPRRRNGRGAQA